jgi:hypothetical protein
MRIVGSSFPLNQGDILEEESKPSAKAEVAPKTRQKETKRSEFFIVN